MSAAAAAAARPPLGDPSVLTRHVPGNGNRIRVWRACPGSGLARELAARTRVPPGGCGVDPGGGVSGLTPAAGAGQRRGGRGGASCSVASASQIRTAARPPRRGRRPPSSAPEQNPTDGRLRARRRPPRGRRLRAPRPGVGGRLSGEDSAPGRLCPRVASPRSVWGQRAGAPASPSCCRGGRPRGRGPALAASLNCPWPSPPQGPGSTAGHVGGRDQPAHSRAQLSPP